MCCVLHVNLNIESRIPVPEKTSIRVLGNEYDKLSSSLTRKPLFSPHFPQGNQYALIIVLLDLHDTNLISK